MSKAKNVRAAKTEAGIPRTGTGRGTRYTVTRDAFRAGIRRLHDSAEGRVTAQYLATGLGMSKPTLYAFAKKFDVSLGLVRGGARG